MKYDLKDKVVLVTGGANGIGKDMVIQAAEKGAKVVFCDIDSEASKKTRVELKVLGLEAYPIVCNVADYNQVEAMFEEIMAKFGKIDVLINNAAKQTVASITDMGYEEWKSVIDVNLNGAFYCIKNAAKHMEPGSVIMNILTIYHNKARVNKYHYDAAKAGLASLTRECALELTPTKGIIVNGVYPGYVLTPMQEDISEEAYQKAITKNLIKNTDASTSKGFAEYVLAFIEHFSHGATGQILGVDAGRGI